MMEAWCWMWMNNIYLPHQLLSISTRPVREKMEVLQKSDCGPSREEQCMAYYNDDSGFAFSSGKSLTAGLPCMPSIFTLERTKTTCRIHVPMHILDLNSTWLEPTARSNYKLECLWSNRNWTFGSWHPIGSSGLFGWLITGILLVARTTRRIVLSGIFLE